MHALLMLASGRSPDPAAAAATAAAGQAAAPGAIVCAALGGAAHLLADRVDAAGDLQKFLISLDLLDPPPPPLPGSPEALAAEAAAAEAAARAAAAEQAALAARPWWHRYLPVRRMSDAEWQQHQAQQDEAERRR